MQDSGTTGAPVGVDPAACPCPVPTSSPPPAPRARPRSWLLLLVLCLGVLGQGERCEIDPRFASPTATLRTFWEALRAGDMEAAEACIEEGDYSGPYPGWVWFMPPSRDLRLESVQPLPVRRGRVVVDYEVHYFALGASEELSFKTQSQLVEARGEWRITAPYGNVTTLEWRPIHRLVPI